MSANRRDFIKFVVAGAVAAGCPIDLSLMAAPPDNKPEVDGEDNRICHQVRDGKVFSFPPASARHDVVIVGGGMSGLAAAYYLQHRDFLLLEKEPHWGGNAYLMEYDGMAYATGAAFVNSGLAYDFAKEIGLNPRPIDCWDGTLVNGEFVADTWADGLDKLPYPSNVKEGFKKCRKELLAVDLNKRGAELYNAPFADLLKDYPPEVKQWWDGYGPSNLGAISDDLAAALGVSELQWMASEKRKDDRATWPGGLGAMSKRLAETLQAKLADRLQAGATTVAVVSDKNEVQVGYVQEGQLKTVAAKAVIMATPKFITRRIVQGLPEAQSEAMHQIRYVPYPVVNLIFDQQVFAKGYDTWCPGNTFTDFIVADWVLRKNQPNYKPKHNILSCYTPLPEEQRGSLLTEQSAARVAAKVLSDFQKLSPDFNVSPKEVHIYRRGHPFFMPTPGLYTKVQPLVRKPMDRIFFANTDSESPVSTTEGAISAAQRAVKEAEHRLAGKPAPKHDVMASVAG
jgi:monoamine oxidase